MVDTVRLYLDVIFAVAIMAAVGVLAGLAVAAITGDRTLVIWATTFAFALTGVVLVIRLWRAAHQPALPIDTNA